MDELPLAVEAEVAYLHERWRAGEGTPRIYSRESRHANTQRQRVTIHNARLVDAPSLDQNGFRILEHTTGVVDFSDKASIKGIYFAEAAELIRSLTGASETFSFPFYQVRSRNPEHFFDAYSRYMHCDFSPARVASFVRSVLEQHDAVERFPAEQWDFALYNLWRPIGSVVEKDPLVFIDASTVAADDVREYLVSATGDQALAAMPLFNPAQQLQYVPAQRLDEVLILKQLDSRPGHAMVCPHTSFSDPTSAADAPERQSIDVRVMCAFPKAQ